MLAHFSQEFLGKALLKSLSDLALVFSCKARNKPPRIASYLRRVITKHCMKIHVKSGSAIESAFPWPFTHLFIIATLSAPSRHLPLEGKAAIREVRHPKKAKSPPFSCQLR